MNAQRYARICEMLARRQPDLTVCMEQVHKPHNVSAIVRTADAVGVHEVHAVWPGARMRTMASTAAGSNSWVSVKTHQTIGEAVSHLKGRGMQILATNLSAKAVDFREIDYTQPVVDIQKRLAVLRRTYIVNGMLAGLPWWFLWVPLLMVLAGLGGHDLYANAPELVWIGLGVGVAGLAATAWFHGWSRDPARPRLARAVDASVTGGSLQRARAQVDEIARFESE